jgi:hypothetical protein
VKLVHRIERKPLRSVSIRYPLYLMIVTTEILVAKSWLGSRLFASEAVGKHHPTMHSTLKPEFDGRVVPLAEANDVPLFLLSGRPFEVLPLLCQSLLVDVLYSQKFLFSPLPCSPLYNHATDAGCFHMITQIVELSYVVIWRVVAVAGLLCS